MGMNFTTVWTYQLSDADNLLHDKLTLYNKKLRPVYNQSKAVSVSIGIELLYIQELDEVKGKFSAMAFILISWSDEQMTWDSTAYGGITQFAVESGDFWTPNFILANPFEQFGKLGDNWTLLRFFSFGHAFLSPGQQFVASCDIDIKYYPWDSQTCAFVFKAYGYIHNEVTLTMMIDNVQMNYFSPNSMWEITNSTADIATTEYTSSAVFSFVLKRKPQFVVFNVILPIVIMSFLSIVVFLIPVDSGEKISYCLTVLLSIAVFLTLIGDSLPRTPSPMPILSWYLLTVMCISVLVTLCTVFSLMMYFRDENKKVPYVLYRLAMFLNCKCRNNNSDYDRVTSFDQVDKNKINLSKSKLTNNGVSLIELPMKGNDNIFLADTNQNLQSEAKSEEITWKDISYAFDKICCAFFIMCLFISTLVFDVKASENQ